MKTPGAALGRRPRPGCFFSLVLLAAGLLAAAGLLLLGAGLIGFLVTLARLGPTLVDAMQHLDQSMAGFVFFTSLGVLLFFVIVGLVGSALASVGLVLGVVVTGPAQPRPVIAQSEAISSKAS